MYVKLLSVLFLIDYTYRQFFRNKKSSKRKILRYNYIESKIVYPPTLHNKICLFNMLYISDL